MSSLSERGDVNQFVNIPGRCRSLKPSFYALVPASGTSLATTVGPWCLCYSMSNCRDLCVHWETAEICLWAKHIFLSLELLFWGQTISRSNPAFVFLLVGYLSPALSGRRSIAVWENERKIRKTSSGIALLPFLFHLTNHRNKRKVTFLLKKNSTEPQRLPLGQFSRRLHLFSCVSPQFVVSWTS